MRYLIPVTEKHKTQLIQFVPLRHNTLVGTSSVFKHSPNFMRVSKKIVTVDRGLKCKSGGRGKNGPAQLGSHYINVRRRNRQKENGTTEDRMGRHVQQGSRSTTITRNQKPERMA